MPRRWALAPPFCFRDDATVAVSLHFPSSSDQRSITSNVLISGGSMSIRARVSWSRYETPAPVSMFHRFPLHSGSLTGWWPANTRSMPETASRVCTARLLRSSGPEQDGVDRVDVTSLRALRSWPPSCPASVLQWTIPTRPAGVSNVTASGSGLSAWCQREKVLPRNFPHPLLRAPRRIENLSGLQQAAPSLPRGYP